MESDLILLLSYRMKFVEQSRLVLHSGMLSIVFLWYLSVDMRMIDTVATLICLFKHGDAVFQIQFAA